MKTINLLIKSLALSWCFISCTSHSQNVDFIGVWFVDSIVSGEKVLVNPDDFSMMDFKSDNTLKVGDKYNFDSPGTWSYDGNEIIINGGGVTVKGKAKYAPDSTIQITGIYEDGNPYTMYMAKSFDKHDLEVQTVKYGYLGNYNNKSFGKAVYGFLGSPKWNSEPIPERNDFLVSVEGDMTFMNKPVTGRFEFKVTSTEDFVLKGFKMNGIEQNAVIMRGVLAKMYE